MLAKPNNVHFTEVPSVLLCCLWLWQPLLKFVADRQSSDVHPSPRESPQPTLLCFNNSELLTLAFDESRGSTSLNSASFFTLFKFHFKVWTQRRYIQMVCIGVSISVCMCVHECLCACVCTSMRVCVCICGVCVCFVHSGKQLKSILLAPTWVKFSLKLCLGPQGAGNSSFEMPTYHYTSH